MRFVSFGALLCGAVVFNAGVHAQEGGADEASYEHYDGQGDYRFVALESYDKLDVCQSLADKPVYSVKPDAGDSLFATGNTLSVFLKTARFHYIPETKYFGFAQAGKGQVAVIANVSQSFDQMASVNGKPAGRVVYYSPLLHENQRINQSFFPGYGPVAYQDGGLYLNMTVLELDHDEKDKVMPALLKTVASLGASELAATSPLVQGMLNTIGAAVLSGSNGGDDIMAKYGLGLLQTYPDSGRVAIPVLKEGDLIIVRKGKHGEPVKWDKLCYRHGRGELKYIKSDGKSEEEPGLGYVVFSIVKGVQGDDQGQYLQKVDDLLEALKKGGDTSFISNVKASLSRMESDALESKYYIDAKSDIALLGNPSTQYREVPATRLATVVQLSLLHATDEAKFNALKADQACAAQASFFDRIVNAAQLENLAGKIKALKLQNPVGDLQLASGTVLGDDCASLASKRSTLAQLLATPLKSDK